jgi:hypothetical protein
MQVARALCLDQLPFYTRQGTVKLPACIWQLLMVSAPDEVQPSTYISLGVMFQELIHPSFLLLLLLPLLLLLLLVLQLHRQASSWVGQQSPEHQRKPAMAAFPPAHPPTAQAAPLLAHSLQPPAAGQLHRSRDEVHWAQLLQLPCHA